MQVGYGILCLAGSQRVSGRSLTCNGWYKDYSFYHLVEPATSAVKGCALYWFYWILTEIENGYVLTFMECFQKFIFILLVYVLKYIRWSLYILSDHVGILFMKMSFTF